MARRLAERERTRAGFDAIRMRRDHRLERASVAFDELAGLLPPQSDLGPDAKGGSLERIGGTYDYSRDRIVIVAKLIQTREQLSYTLAHELTHALEDQRFRLRLAMLSDAGERARVRGAVIEGTATLVQELYRQRYLHDQIPVALRIEGMRSVIDAAPGAYAIHAQAIFDYVDGALFARSLRRRAGGWRLVNRALRRGPRRSTEILHPAQWPGTTPAPPVRLRIAPSLRDHWQLVGAGAGDEQQALAILLAGGISSEAASGAAGWDGGRFAVWRHSEPGSACEAGCPGSELGVIGFRWRRARDAGQFALAVPTYMIAGRLAEHVGERTWKVGDGYAALGTANHGSALAFAPSRGLSASLSARAAASAAQPSR